MKYLIAVFLCIFGISARAQITLEHVYPWSGPHWDFGLVEVDSGEWKYVGTPYDTIVIYNLDHSVDRVVPFPASIGSLLVVAKRLFTQDSTYCFLGGFFDTATQASGLKIFSEDGSVLFSRDSCVLGTNKSEYENNIGALDDYFPPAIRTTPAGTKMIITTYLNNVEIYSLPGKLPTRQSKPSGVTPTRSAGAEPTLPTSAYPNPSAGVVRIAYQLPLRVSSGEVIITDEEGREVKRYRVTNAFSDLEIEESDLPSGSYLYRLVTSKGESAAQRIVCEK